MDADLQRMLAYPAYGLYLLIILGGGVMAVGSTSLVRALLGLILTLFGVTGMYLLMSATFVAFMQLLIYVGAVSVLIFFAIMLTKTPDGEAGGEEATKLGGRLVLAALAGLVPVGILAWALIKFNPEALPLKSETSLLKLGEFLVGPYALAFELISVVLFAAMAGAVLLGFERRKGR
jgi:NADH-quinone oxidoreductase subunit J